MNSRTTDTEAQISGQPTMTPAPTTGPNVTVHTDHTRMEFGLPHFIWDGLDDESQERVRGQYAHLGRALMGVLESAMLNPELFNLSRKLTKSTLDQLHAHNDAHAE